MTEERDLLVWEAKFAEQVERYDSKHAHNYKLNITSQRC